MSGMNVNNREKSMIFYREDMEEDMWIKFCRQAEKDPDAYEWLRVSFDVSDVDDSDDDLFEGETEMNRPGINWKAIYEKIGGYAADFGGRFETLECAAHNGNSVDLDWMMHLNNLIGMPISFDFYIHVNRHLDGCIQDLTKEDIPALMWLVDDYAMNGLIKEDIWDGYDFDSYKDECGYCGWHKRVMDGLKGE